MHLTQITLMPLLPAWWSKFLASYCVGPSDTLHSALSMNARIIRISSSSSSRTMRISFVSSDKATLWNITGTFRASPSMRRSAQLSLGAYPEIPDRNPSLSGTVSVETLTGDLLSVSISPLARVSAAPAVLLFHVFFAGSWRKSCLYFLYFLSCFDLI